jgi:hypothetical protein
LIRYYIFSAIRAVLSSMDMEKGIRFATIFGFISRLGEAGS